MVQINFAQKSVTVKIVYYGPGMSGKTTNLEIVHQRAPDGSRGDLTSISTDGDRTLFFDFMPLDLGTVAGMKTQFQIYTVPGQVYYNSTRKLVLQGVDGVIFVADSSASMMEENLESLRNLHENLTEYGKEFATMPMVIQYNKRDLPDALPVAELESALNPTGRPSFEGVANTGQGVFPTLKALAALVLDSIHQKSGGAGTSATSAAPAPAPAPAAQAPSMPNPAAPSMQPPSIPSAPLPIGGIPQDAPPAMAAANEVPAPVAADPMPAPIASQPAPIPAPMAQAPAAPPVSPVPSIAMAQTPAPAPSFPTPAAGVPALEQAGVHPQMAQSSLSQTGAHPQMTQPMQIDLSQTGAHPQMTQPMQPAMNVAPAPAPAPAPEAAPGLRIAQPVATALQEPVPVGQPAPTPNVMQVPTGTTAPPPPATSRSLPSAPPRIKPRQSALATPTHADGRKSAMITVGFVAAALAAGVAIGGLAFGMF